MLCKTENSADCFVLLCRRDAMQEASSKTTFPALLDYKGKDGNAKLRVFATGLRTKLMFQVYAFGSPYHRTGSTVLRWRYLGSAMVGHSPFSCISCIFRSTKY
jgi:hypothetical protein